MARQQADLLRIPLESLEQVLQWLGPVARGQAAMACQQLRKAAQATVLEDVTITLDADNVSTLAQWLQAHGQKISKLHIQAPSLHSSISKAALWDALSNPSAVARLTHLHLDMPLTPGDETAIISRICSSAPTLTSLHLHYQRPLSHAKKSNAMCFCAHVNSALWATAQQLRALRLTGACLCNTSSITQLSGLTTLQLSCCNSAAQDAGLAQLLHTLPELQELHYTTSKRAVLTSEVAAMLAGHSSLKRLELHNFALPGLSLAGQLEGNATAFAAAAGVGGTAGASDVSNASAAATAVLLGVALRQLQVVKLVDCVGVRKLLPHLASSAVGKQLQLQHLGLARSRQDGFMPCVLTGLFSDSDSDDSDSASDSEDSDSTDCVADDSHSAGGGSSLTGCCSIGSGSATSSACCPLDTCTLAQPAATTAVTEAPLHVQVRKPSNSNSMVSSSGKVSSLKAKLLRGIAPIAMLHTLTNLDLSGLGLNSIEPLCSLGNINTLKLGPAAGAVGSSHYVNCLDDEGLAGIEVLQQLQHLDLAHNQLSWDSTSLLQDLGNLTYLSLAGNHLVSSNRCGSALTTCSLRSCEGALQCAGNARRSERCAVSSAGRCNSTTSDCSDSVARSGSFDSCSSSELAFLTAAEATVGSSKLLANRKCDVPAVLEYSNKGKSSRLIACSNRSSSSSNGRAGSGSNCSKICSSCSGWTLPCRLRHLDVTGCSLSSIPGLSDLTHLTSLKAGTGLRHMRSGVWVKVANQLSPSTVADVAALPALQDLELASNIPAWCYSGLAALSQLTRLVVQDFSAVEGLFGQEQTRVSCCCSTRSSTAVRCSFPLLLELGIMLRSRQSFAAMRHLPQSCRALKRLSVYQDLSAATTDAQLLNSSSNSWHVPCLSGLSGLTRLDVQPPADLRLLSGLSQLRHLQLLGPAQGWKPGDRESGAQGNSGCCGPDALPGCGSVPVEPPGCCGPDALPGCCKTRLSQPAAAAAAPYGSFCQRLAELSGTQLAAKVVTDDEVVGLAGLTNLTQLELQHVCAGTKAVDQLQVLLPCTRIIV